jgi:microsomal dipeptidase-like Zn-dependent dipeptidase
LRSVPAKPRPGTTVSSSRRRSAAPTPIIDLHAHIPVQLPPPERPCDSEAQRRRNRLLMEAANRFFNFENPLEPRYPLKDARKAGVHIGSVLFQPADELFGPCEPFANVMQQIRMVNDRLAEAKYTLARRPKDLSNSIANGTPAAFHVLEGGFSVGDPKNVTALAREGVAYIVLAHLVFRGVSANVNAFPFMTDAEYERMFATPVPGLTQFGIDVCREMCRRGIIPDATHATEAAVEQIFAIADANRPKRPVIVSHGAPRAAAAGEPRLNLSEKTILGIRDRGGVVGVIFDRHWLGAAVPGGQAGVGLVAGAVRRIAEVAGTTECIALGSDLDGFIDPVDGLTEVRRIRVLEQTLLDEGFEPSEVAGILWKNALRTLSIGWGAS